MTTQPYYKLFFLTLFACTTSILFAQNAFTRTAQQLLDDSVFVETLSFGTEIDSFYQSNAYNRVFNRADLKGALVFLDEKDTVSYQLVDSLSKQRNIQDKVLTEFFLMDALLLAVLDFNNGVISIENRFQSEDPSAGFFYPEKKMDNYTLLTNYKSTKDLSVFETIQIKNSQYFELEKQLDYYQELASNGGWDSLYLSTENDTVMIGDRSELVAAIRKRLFMSKDLLEEDKLSSKIFDKDIEKAVKLFQYRHNIDTTGFVEVNTIDALNKSVQSIVYQLEVNLERWQWLPNYLGKYHVQSNIPSFSTKLIEEDTLVAFHKTVVGKPVRATPLFYDTMTYMDVNPTWTVPPTIVENEILSNPGGYIGSHKITIINATSGEVVPMDSVNWSKYKRYKFIQGSGSGNALGRLKFIFPNQHYIFIHDTPTKRHFGYDYRAYSSGCMRIQDPQDFANSLLKEDSTYTPEKIEEYLEETKTKRIVLKKKPIVYLTYFTMEVNEKGQLMMYQDIYGYDKILQEKLAAK